MAGDLHGKPAAASVLTTSDFSSKNQNFRRKFVGAGQSHIPKPSTPDE